MKRILTMAALTVLAAAPAHGQDQNAAEAETALRLPLVEGVSAAPDCGGLYGLGSVAQCMSAPLSQLPAVAELYMTALPQAGWAHVDGGDNQVMFQNTRDDGQCDFLVMLAFYDDTLPEDALDDATGYLGFVLRTEGTCMEPRIEEEAAPSE